MDSEDQTRSVEDLRSEVERLREEQDRLHAEIEERERARLEHRAQARGQKRTAKQLRADLKEHKRQAERLKAELELREGGGRRGLLVRLRLRLLSFVELRRENAKLRAEVKRLRRIEAAVKGAGGMVARILAGSRLREAFRAWTRVTREAETPRDLFSQESADLGAAILHRVIRVGLFGLALAILPAVLAAGLTTWQNVLIREQNAKIQSQIEQQASDNLIVRRAQLLATIYEEECEESEGGETTKKATEDTEGTQGGVGQICRPRSPVRARQEAALAFIEIERGRDAAPDLSRANLIDADLVKADLANVDLSRAKFSGAKLGGADLRGAKLEQKQIDSAIGDAGTQLPEGLEYPLFWMLWTDVDLWNRWRKTGVDSWNRWRKQDPVRPVLQWANLNWADLRRADLSEANLVLAKLYGAELGGANLSEADLIGANLSRANLSEANLISAALSGANLSEANLSGANLSEANLSGANLSEAKLMEADLSGANLNRADLSRAKLIKVYLKQAKLYGADLNGAILSGADLSGADLSKAMLTVARNLTQPQIDSARGNAETKLPGNLKRPAHWLEEQD